MGQIILVPTSHIAEESIAQVKKTIREEKPDCVAVELDEARYHALAGRQERHAPVRQLGVMTAAIYLVFSALQQSLGRRVGIFPGSEMRAAVTAAQQEGARVALIDQPLGRTLLGIKTISFHEKAKLLWFVAKGLTVGALLSKRIDLKRLPSDDLIAEAISLLQKEFPHLYWVLVEERDRYMARMLAVLAQRHDKVVAVIGAGHQKGIETLLQGQKVSTWRASQ